MLFFLENWRHQKVILRLSKWPLVLQIFLKCFLRYTEDHFVYNIIVKPSFCQISKSRIEISVGWVILWQKLGFTMIWYMKWYLLGVFKRVFSVSLEVISCSEGISISDRDFSKDIPVTKDTTSVLWVVKFSSGGYKTRKFFFA